MTLFSAKCAVCRFFSNDLDAFFVFLFNRFFFVVLTRVGDVAIRVNQDSPIMPKRAKRIRKSNAKQNFFFDKKFFLKIYSDENIDVESSDHNFLVPNEIAAHINGLWEFIIFERVFPGSFSDLYRYR